MIWPHNALSLVNQITPMNERKRLRSSSSSSPSTSSLGCQTDADLDNLDDDILPWCAISLAWQETDSSYALNGDIETYKR